MQHRNRRIARTAVWAAAAGLALLTAGCGAHDDPHYNPYAPHNGRASLMRSADGLNMRLDRAASDIDLRTGSILD